MAAIYLLAASWLIMRRYPLACVKTAAVLLIVTASFFVGARLLFTVHYLPKVLANPVILVKFRLVNFTLFGGPAAALPTWWLAAKRLGPRTGGDQVAPETQQEPTFITKCGLTGCR